MMLKGPRDHRTITIESTSLIPKTNSLQSRRRSRPESTTTMDPAAPSCGTPNKSASCTSGFNSSNRLFQINFSYEEIGRYHRQSKRRIRWVVGSLDEDEGLLEHSFELVWSIKSGKTKVVWNGIDISHLFITPSPSSSSSSPRDTVSFSWQTSAGVEIQIQARAENIISEDPNRRHSPQYDLLMDGRSFFALPTRAELEKAATTTTSANTTTSCCSCDSSGSALISSSHLTTTTVDATCTSDCACTSAGAAIADAPIPSRDDVPAVEHPPVLEERTPEYNPEIGVFLEEDHGHGHQSDDNDDDDLGSGDGDNNHDHIITYCGTSASEIDFRLSMAGLNHSATGEQNEVVDELRSELYSPMLETLRRRISEYLPQLEDMVSKAIINAFFVDSGDCSQHSTTTSSGGGYNCSLSESMSSLDMSNSSNCSCKKDPNQVEVDSMRTAYDWVGSKMNPDLRLSFMQKQIDAIFVYVRNDEISPEQASRILLSVACILGLEFAKPLPLDAVILTYLLPVHSNSTTPSPTLTNADLTKALSKFGTVSAAAVSFDRGFGFGRFQDVGSVSSLLNHKISLHDHVPAIEVLSSSLSLSPLSTHMTDEPNKKIQEETTPRMRTKKNARSATSDGPYTRTADSRPRSSNRSRPGSSRSCSSSPTLPIPHLMAPLGMDFAFCSSWPEVSATTMASYDPSSTLAAAHRQPPSKPRSISHDMRETSPQSILEW